MSAKKQLEKEIREAYVFLREKNNTIPSETLSFMLDASLEKLNGQLQEENKKLKEENKELRGVIALDSTERTNLLESNRQLKQEKQEWEAECQMLIDAKQELLQMLIRFNDADYLRMIDWEELEELINKYK